MRMRSITGEQIWTENLCEAVSQPLMWFYGRRSCGNSVSANLTFAFIAFVTVFLVVFSPMPVIARGVLDLVGLVRDRQIHR
jgi:hypothetical protein